MFPVLIASSWIAVLVPAVASAEQKVHVTRESCGAWIDALAGQRYDREAQPLRDFMTSVAEVNSLTARKAIAANLFMGPPDTTTRGCPPGFRLDVPPPPSDATCSAVIPRGPTPNVELYTVGFPEIVHQPGKTYVCTSVFWLVFSLGSDTQKLCTLIERKPFSHELTARGTTLAEQLALAREAFGKSAGDGKVGAIPLANTREHYLAELKNEACEKQPTAAQASGRKTSDHIDNPDASGTLAANPPSGLPAGCALPGP